MTEFKQIWPAVEYDFRYLLRTAVVVVLTFAAQASSLVVAQNREITTQHSLVGSWVGYSNTDDQPRMRVHFSESGWLTKEYLGDRTARFRCTYRFGRGGVVQTACADRGLRVHRVDANTIEFRVTDSKTVESIDEMYTLIFRRVTPSAQPN